ncbi:hypothetical protein WIS52_23260 [Pseudonocardia nematodicida]|uniref:Uncharacterized protein n=1 Tax=Pseudonocardia nematodicida TaxID=1206997 RepID=A0ABV1KG06_9PSEU
MTEAPAITIRLPARLWAGIDANLDNAVDLAIMDGDDATADLGTAIRETGSGQVPWVDGRWPPREQELRITLDEAHWSFVLDHLQRSRASYERLGDHESLQLGQDTIEAVRRQLS